METCLDQYKANKANNANGGLKWIQKGGGYYSECNKHLKGSRNDRFAGADGSLRAAARITARRR